MFISVSYQIINPLSDLFQAISKSGYIAGQEMAFTLIHYGADIQVLER